MDPALFEYTFISRRVLLNQSRWFRSSFSLESKKSVVGAEGGRTSRSCQAGSEPFIPVIRASRLRPFSNIYSFAFLISRSTLCVCSAKATNELGEGARPEVGTCPCHRERHTHSHSRRGKITKQVWVAKRRAVGCGKWGWVVG